MMDEYNKQVDSGQINFDNIKNSVLSYLEADLLNINKLFDILPINNEIVKTAVEHGFRTYILNKTNKINNDDLKSVFDISIIASQKKLCAPTTPIFLINDVLSNLTIDQCSNIFNYLEDSSHIWKSELFYSSVKNYLLRMCNDLLKRLSKSQNTVFSGRIHLFLAKLFPLNDKSGLNLMSHFSENATRYTTSADLFDRTISKNKHDSMDIDDTNIDESLNKSNSQMAIPIDYNLYRKFWSLQDFFSKPNTLYDKATWKLFTNNSNEVLDALKSYTLDDVKVNSKKFDDDQVYFAKYLTSAKLLDLQLNDSNFRRQILIQFIILFQYLYAEVRFKANTQVLNEEQNLWIKNASSKVYELLKETPPDGETFAMSVKHILEREEIWNKWKNEGCPNFVKEKKGATFDKLPQKRPRLLTSNFVPGSKYLKLDDSEITKLCNVNHDNLNACKDPNRQFLPSLKDFFEEAIEQIDPANQIEKQYYLFNNTDWSWKALRLLAKRSAFYFMQNQNVKTVSEYLEAICRKLSKELPINSTEQTGNSNEMENIPLNEEETVQITDEAIASQTTSNQNNSLNTNDVNSNTKNHKIDKNSNNEIKESGTNLSNEERLIKLKQEFQMDEYQDDSQSSNNSSTPPPHSSIKQCPQNLNTMAIDSNVDILNEVINEAIMNSLSDLITSAQDWKKFAQTLCMDEDTIAFIESELTDIKAQCKKILLLWKEKEEKKATLLSLINALKSSGHTVYALELENKFSA